MAVWVVVVPVSSVLILLRPDCWFRFVSAAESVLLLRLIVFLVLSVIFRPVFRWLLRMVPPFERRRFRS